jgi:hypothetical protein
MPRYGKSTAVPLRQAGGRLVSARSKTGNPECSAAMSAWVRGRKTGIVAAAVYAMLGKCRAMAHQLRQGQLAGAAGKPLKAQAMQARAKRGLPANARARLAKQKAAERVAKRTKPEAAAAPTQPGWNLKQESAAGRRAFRPENAGAGKTGTMFDMKRGDLKGQVTLMDRFGTVHTHHSPPATEPEPVTGHKEALKRLESIQQRSKAMTAAQVDQEVDSLASLTVAELREVQRAHLGATIGKSKGEIMSHLRQSLHNYRSSANRAEAISQYGRDGEVISRQTSKQQPGPAHTQANRELAARRARAIKVADRGPLKPVKERTGAGVQGPTGPGHFARQTPTETGWRGKGTAKYQVTTGHATNQGPAGQIGAADAHQRRAFGASLWSHRRGTPTQAPQAGRGQTKPHPLDVHRAKLDAARAQREASQAKLDVAHTKLGAAKHRLASANRPDDALARGRENLARRTETAKRLQAARQIRNEQHAPETHGRVGKAYEIGTDKVHFDPDRFQYKLAAQGAHGTTEALKDVKKWDAELAGTVSVWKDPINGKTYVVNGHHRLDLARRMGVGSIHARFIDAPDAQTARAKGALVNIAEGRGTAVDAAKFFRDTGLSHEQAKARGLSLREHTAGQGLAMAGLEDHAFKRVINGELTPARAAIIGGSGLSHEQQRQLVKVLDKPRNKKISDGTVRHMVDEAREAGSRTKTTRDLFGSNEEEESLFVHRAQVADTIKRGLAADKKLFGLVSKSKHAEALAERGRSSIDTAETGKVSHEAAAVLGVFDQLKNRDKRISGPLNEAAERIANGESRKTVEAEARRKISEHIKRVLEGDVDPFG